MIIMINFLHIAQPYLQLLSDISSPHPLTSPVFLLRRRGEEPPEGHSYRDCGLPPYLLCGLLWSVCSSHYDDAVLLAGQEQPPARCL